jgi:hypothetical protein
MIWKGFTPPEEDVLLVEVPPELLALKLNDA